MGHSSRGVVLGRALSFAILALLLVVSRSSERQDGTSHVPAFATFRYAGQTLPAACVQVWRCVARYIQPTLTPDAIRLIEAEGMKCFSDDKDELDEQSACLPLRLGVDAQNRRPIEIAYTCSDVCPRYGGILLLYAHVTENECCALGGYPLQDSAFGTYIGCSPPEALAQFRHVRRSDTPADALVRLCTPGECLTAACTSAAEMAEEDALVRELMRQDLTGAVTPAR